MTREEAIAILDGFKHNPLFNEQHFEALDMAISALSENNGDLISRQAVLDKFSDYVGGGMSMNDFDALWDIVEKIPSIENKGESEEGGKT